MRAKGIPLERSGLSGSALRLRCSVQLGFSGLSAQMPKPETLNPKTLNPKRVEVLSIGALKSKP